MKMSAAVLSDWAWRTLEHELDGPLGDFPTTDEVLPSIERASMALHIKAALARGQKRITIDIVRTK